MRRDIFLSGLAAISAAGLLPATADASGARPGRECLPINPHHPPGILPFDLPVLGAKGQRLSADALTGKAVWLNFFASWCGDCVVEMNDVLSLEAKYRHAGLTMIGIDTLESEAHAFAFRDQFRIPYTILTDPDGAVFNTIGTNHLPTHLFYTASGTLTCIGIEGLSYKDMDNEIAVILGS